MRIKKISVRKLFGNPSFDYDIELNQVPPITILHGRNGTGKTVIFKMISGLFNARNLGHFIFWKYPFTKFCLEFDDGESVTVTRSEDEESGDYSFPVLEYSKYPDKKVELNQPTDDFLRLPRSVRTRMLRDLDLDSAFREMAGFKFIDDWAVSIFDSSRRERRRKKKKRDDEWLRALSTDLKIELIDTNRLIAASPSESRSDQDEDSSNQITAAIDINSEDLSERIQQVINLRDNLANTLDRSFPRKVVDEVLSSDATEPLTYEDIKDALDELEDLRKDLVDVGLLERDEQKTEFQIPDEGEKVDENPTLRRVLQRYIEDTQQKLGQYQELAAKIDLFKVIIQGMLTDKEFNITKMGFDFRRIGARPIIPLAELSSGEQHVIVLMYNLLFREWEKDKAVQKENPDQLILIDEPEISLHIDWQEQFVNNLKKITSLSSEVDDTTTDIIVATHSPAIPHENWDLEQVLVPKQTENE